MTSFKKLFIYFTLVASISLNALCGNQSSIHKKTVEKELRKSPHHHTDLSNYKNTAIKGFFICLGGVLLLFIGKKWGEHIAASTIEPNQDDQVIQNENISPNSGPTNPLCQQDQFVQASYNELGTTIADYPQYVRDFIRDGFSRIEIQAPSNRIIINENDILMQDRNKKLIDFIKEEIEASEGIPSEQQTLKCINKGADTLHFALLLRVRAPVMYMYTEQEVEVRVQFDDNEPTICHPAYPGKWEFRVLPTISTESYTNLVDVAHTKNSYPYLYYELDIPCNRIQSPNLNRGFVVQGSKVHGFFSEKLPCLGLNPRESADFMMYWLSKFDTKKRYFVHFVLDNDVETLLKLTVEPRPTYMRRVMMMYTELEPDEHPNFLEQVFPSPFERKGFHVVEWGGMKVYKKCILKEDS